MARDKYTVMGNIEKHKRRREIIEKHTTVGARAVLFLQKGERDLQVATSTFQNGQEEKQPLLQSSFYNWVVVIGYYAMFHAARGALAKLRVHISEDNVHEAVLNGMYYYYLHSGLIEKHIYDILEDASQKRQKAIQLIEKLEQGRSQRGNVNYEVAKSVQESLAKDTLKDAKEFINAMRILIAA